MTAHGMSPEEIAREIRAAPEVSFDLDPDVVVELREAGVAESVIKVMIEAQKARAPAPPPAPAPAAPVAAQIELTIEAEPGSLKAGRLVMPVAEIGWFAACVEPTHVPDYWQTKTPLADAIPRHRLLWFQEAAAAPSGRPGRRPAVPHELPAPASFTLEPGTHRILVGIVARDPEKKWQLVAGDDRSVEIEAGATTRLVARVLVTRQPGKLPISLKIVAPPGAPFPSD